MHEVIKQADLRGSAATDFPRNISFVKKLKDYFLSTIKLQILGLNTDQEEMK